MSNSKLLIKNTAFLYFRMAVLLVISLFTSRVVLDKLGVVDYGICNVVGGITGMLAFFSSALSNATQRFLCIELAKGDIEGARKVFSQNFMIFLLFLGLILIIGETLGVWFFESKLVIPEERLAAARFVYQFSLLCISLSFLRIPFDASIIAHENMKIYSYVGLYEGFSKLGVAYALIVTDLDRLIVYSFLGACVSVSVFLFYFIYCRSQYSDCRFQFSWDRQLTLKLGGFASWNLFGTFIYMTKDQVVNVLMNLFFGPAINAARGLSFTINSTLAQFISNISTSVQPQVVKSYAAGDFEYLYKLFFRSTKFSFLLFWFLSLPVIVSIHPLLALWLVDVPDYTEIFTILVLVESLLSTLTSMPWGVTLAIGNLKRYTIWGNGTLLLILPVSYVALRLGASPVSVFLITVGARVLQVAVVLLISNNYINFGLYNYLKRVVTPLSIVLTVSISIMYVVRVSTSYLFLDLCINSVLCVLINLMLIWTVAIDDEEKDFVKEYLQKFINRK